MKKITKLFAVLAASLLMTVSFSSCAEFFNAMFGAVGELTVVTDKSAYSGKTVTVTFEKYNLESDFTDSANEADASKSYTLRANGAGVAVDNFLKTLTAYKVSAKFDGESAKEVSMGEGVASLDKTHKGEEIVGSMKHYVFEPMGGKKIIITYTGTDFILTNE